RGGGRAEGHRRGLPGGGDALEQVDAGVEVRVERVADLRLDRRGQGDDVGAAELLDREADAVGARGRRVGVGAQRVGRDGDVAAIGAEVDQPGRADDPQDLVGGDGGRVHVAVERHVEGADGAVEDQVVGRDRGAGDVGRGDVRAGDDQRQGVLVEWP